MVLCHRCLYAVMTSQTRVNNVIAWAWLLLKYKERRVYDKPAFIVVLKSARGKKATLLYVGVTYYKRATKPAWRRKLLCMRNMTHVWP